MSIIKIRVVYDGSAKSTATNHSLNDCLYRGPVTLHPLTGILLRFRTRPVAITADIEKAFFCKLACHFRSEMLRGFYDQRTSATHLLILTTWKHTVSHVFLLA